MSTLEFNTVSGKNNQLVVTVFSLVMFMLIFVAGCDDDGGPQRIIDETIPVNETWEIYNFLELEKGTGVPAGLKLHQQGNVMHMAYFDRNPLYNEDDAENNTYPYRVKYHSFPLSSREYLVNSPDQHEVIALLERGGMFLDTLDVSVADSTPMVAYFRFKVTHEMDFDMGNQGDIYIAVNEGPETWRHEIAAYGYNPRNGEYLDGLAMADVSLVGDEEGGANLCYQFYYEGEDQDNFAFPDLRYVNQPLDAFINETVEAVADVEEVVEGNQYAGSGAGQQNDYGGMADLVIDQDGNHVVFYYVEGTTVNDISGLRMAKRINGEWQQPVWVERNVHIADISAAVKPDGTLAVAYAVIGLRDPIVEEEQIPLCLRYAEEPHVEEGSPYPFEWEGIEIVDFTNICGRFCSLAIDSEGTPIIAYYEEMNYMYIPDDNISDNYSSNRFFSRLKIATKRSFNSWTYYVIPPEYVGLSNNTNPYSITSGQHDQYYIGKYNYLWLDDADRKYLCSYSTITNKAYLFIER